MPLSFRHHSRKIAKYYRRKLLLHGLTPQGADWRDKEAQWLSFEQLCHLLPSLPSSYFSLLDYGCGYGALVEFLRARYMHLDYTGFDICPDMIKAARALYPDLPFYTRFSLLRPKDYVIASGLFSVKLNFPEKIWQKYVLRTLKKINNLAIKGFSFSSLTKYSDKNLMKDYLYYPDPCFYFDYCKKKFSKNVSLLHDYERYEFVIIVRK